MDANIMRGARVEQVDVVLADRVEQKVDGWRGELDIVKDMLSKRAFGHLQIRQHGSLPAVIEANSNCQLMHYIHEKHQEFFEVGRNLEPTTAQCSLGRAEAGGEDRQEGDDGMHGADAGEPPSQHLELSVMSWNLLARQYTKHNRHYHLAGPDVEDPSQTRRRYTIAGDEIVNRNCDLVFLQECEAAFFIADWNLAATELNSKYMVFRCPQEPETSPGTAVLVKRDGQAVAEASRPLCIGGISEVGGPGKVATVVPMRVASRSFVAVSTHFTFSGNAAGRRRHADLIGKEVRGRSVVLGGDFNCVPGAQLQALESFTFLGSLLRVPVDTATGLNSDFTREVCIDHFYISDDLGEARAVALAEPSNPWGGNATHPAEVTGASDHVPIMAHVALAEELADGEGYGDQERAVQTATANILLI